MKKNVCIILKQNDNYSIPQLGFGTFMLENYEECKRAVLLALKNGYRHIDTAQVYKNEAAVGDAITESGIAREEIYLTTKIWASNLGYEKTKNSLQRSMEKLKVDYVDLVLIHRPYGNYLDTWKALEEAVISKKVRSIGVSNFSKKQTQDILDIAKIKPVINQIECHPYYQQKELRMFLKQNDILTEAWYPLGHGDKNLFQDSMLVELSKKYHKSVVQIILRWHIQSENIIFPKTTSEKHMKENYDIFDFELTDEEMNKISMIDKNKSYFKGPEWFDRLKAIFIRV